MSLFIYFFIYEYRNISLSTFFYPQFLTLSIIQIIIETILLFYKLIILRANFNNANNNTQISYS